MAEQTHVTKRVEKVRGRDLQGKVHVLDKTQPQQLVLFQTFLPEDDPDEKFSNTIEFYDAIPKYFSAPFKFQLTVSRKPLVMVGW